VADAELCELVAVQVKRGKGEREGKERGGEEEGVDIAWQRRQRELKVGGTSLVSRLSACLTEANSWRLIAE